MLILLKEICHDLFSKAAFRERTSERVYSYRSLDIKQR